MGVGNKPFLDIKPSEAAINDRAIDYIMKGRGIGSSVAEPDGHAGAPKPRCLTTCMLSPACSRSPEQGLHSRLPLRSLQPLQASAS